MKAFATALLGATLLTASATAAAPQHMFEPGSFGDLGDVFRSADLDKNGTLSKTEWELLRIHMVDDNYLRDYRGDGAKDLAPTVARTYAAFDRNNDGQVTENEFIAIASRPAPAGAAPAAAANRWDGNPEYMTVTYYLMVNPIDADNLDGHEVVNLEGERVGEIRNIIRTEDENRYYAMIDLAGNELDIFPSRLDYDTVGVPLNDVLLFKDGDSLFLSTRGEEYLRDVDRRNIGDNWEEVDKLYLG